MIITRIALQDYGVYRGRAEFDLEPSDGKPIVLLGGANGAGKTTLFESVMLCLYGIASLGKQTTKKSYHEFLAKKIHRRPGARASAGRASVAVGFRSFRGGREEEYAVTRSWARDGGGVEEELDVRKGDRGGAMRPLDTVERVHWQSFVGDLVPKGIMKLFFFDGEKVVEMAREGGEDATIRESFKSLLGLEIIEQLRSDLQVGMARNLTRGDRALREDFERGRAEKEECGTTVARLREARARKQNDLDALSRDIEAAESRIAKVGGGFAERRGAAKKRLEEKKLAHNAARQRILDLCAGALPLAAIPGSLAGLEEQIRADERAQRRIMGKELADARMKKIRVMGTKSFWDAAGIPEGDAARAAAAASSLLDALEDPDPPDRPALGLSAEQSSRMLDTIRAANTSALDSLKEHTEAATRLAGEMLLLERSIASAPGDDELGSLVSEIGRLRTREGTLRAEAEHIDQKIASNLAMMGHLDTRLQATLSRIYDAEKSETRVALSRSVQAVLGEFVEKLRAKKIRAFEGHLEESIGILMHKKSLIKRASVEPETFEISLHGDGGRVLQKDLLSTGEKQMLATAVLWSLAKTSGRPLPFMIDTPLARLDERHRASMVERFLPAASHQVIVLSTDSEIGENYHKALAPHLSREYALEYVEGEGATRLRESYFWRGGRKVVAV